MFWRGLRVTHSLTMLLFCCCYVSVLYEMMYTMYTMYTIYFGLHVGVFGGGVYNLGGLCIQLGMTRFKS